MDEMMEERMNAIIIVAERNDETSKKQSRKWDRSLAFHCWSSMNRLPVLID